MTQQPGTQRPQTAPVKTHRADAGKYLTFTLGTGSYGLPILRVREIIRMAAITKIPGLPEYFRGVLNLRGKVIPVADLRAKLHLTPNPADTSERTCIVVVELSSANRPPLGLMVDSVEEVVNIVESELEGPPDFGGLMDTTGILGMAKLKGQVKTILDIDQVIRVENLPVFRAQAVSQP